MALVKDFNRQCVQLASVNINLADVVNNVALEVMDMPPNSVILSGQLITTEAWNSTTSDVLDVGDATTATRYLTDGNIRALGARVALVPTGFTGTGEPLKVVWTSGGGTPTTGKVRLEVQYYIIGRAETTIG
jgi:hypothetical protein